MDFVRTGLESLSRAASHRLRPLLRVGLFALALLQPLVSCAQGMDALPENLRLSALDQGDAAAPTETGPGVVQEVPPLISQMVVLVFLALLPFLVLLLTSFLKVVVVLGLLRNALGVQQAPPNQVINGIALIMAIYVMFPTGLAMWERAQAVAGGNLPEQLFSANSAQLIFNVVRQSSGPLKEFLERNAGEKHLRGFYRLSQRTFPPQVRESITVHDWIVVTPAFITSQVESAFEIGVLIYLPFFVVDLVTSNLLLAMGMMMLSPMTIALPLKLLLLVMLDGWTVLTEGLVLTFKP